MLSRVLPPTPTSVVAEASSSCSRATSARNSCKGVGVPVADHAGHLEVVHGEDHPARGAGLGDLGHAGARLGQRGADAAELDGDQRAEEAGGLQGLEGLEGEAGTGVDVVGRGRRRRSDAIVGRPRGDLGPAELVALILGLQSC